MITEKIYFRALITPDFICDSIGGPQSVVEWLEYRIEQWARKNGWFLFARPTVRFFLPDQFMAPEETVGMVGAHVFARAVKVQFLEER